MVPILGAVPADLLGGELHASPRGAGRPGPVREEVGEEAAGFGLCGLDLRQDDTERPRQPVGLDDGESPPTRWPRRCSRRAVVSMSS
jgi:hypothetical protein